MSSSLFSSPDPVPLSEKVSSPLENDSIPQIDPSTFNDTFAISATAEKILRYQFAKIALQFPDPLLSFSVPIYQALNQHLSESLSQSQSNNLPQLYVLADTSYSNCCVDEVAASHIDADAIVHYGHACLSRTSRLPVIYVFPKAPLPDIDACVEAFSKALLGTSSDLDPSLPILAEFRYAVSYSWAADAIWRKLAKRTMQANLTLIHKPLPDMMFPQRHSDLTHEVPSSPQENGPDPPICYIGTTSDRYLSYLALCRPTSSIHVYTPPTMNGNDNQGTIELISPLTSPTSKRFLMKRYAAIQKARDSDVFGLLVGTLGVASYLSLLSTLRHLLKSYHKKSYTVSVGKPTPQKLANFMEIECWVVIDCKEGSLGWTTDQTDFYKPIITPFELIHALMPIERLVWGVGQEYTLNFERLVVLMNEDIQARKDSASNQSNNDMEKSNDSDDDDDNNNSDSTPQFSFTSGRHRDVRRFNNAPPTENFTKGKEKASDSSIVLAAQRTELERRFETSSPAAQFLHSRAYQGLSHDGDERDETSDRGKGPVRLEQGRSGIAKGYQGL